jgi:hypothetical protein
MLSSLVKNVPNMTRGRVGLSVFHKQRFGGSHTRSFSLKSFFDKKTDEMATVGKILELCSIPVIGWIVLCYDFDRNPKENWILFETWRKTRTQRKALENRLKMISLTEEECKIRCETDDIFSIDEYIWLKENLPKWKSEVRVVRWDMDEYLYHYLREQTSFNYIFSGGDVKTIHYKGCIQPFINDDPSQKHEQLSMSIPIGLKNLKAVILPSTHYKSFWRLKPDTIDYYLTDMESLEISSLCETLMKIRVQRYLKKIVLKNVDINWDGTPHECVRQLEYFDAPDATFASEHLTEVKKIERLVCKKLCATRPSTCFCPYTKGQEPPSRLTHIEFSEANAQNDLMAFKEFLSGTQPKLKVLHTSDPLDSELAKIITESCGAGKDVGVSYKFSTTDIASIQDLKSSSATLVLDTISTSLDNLKRRPPPKFFREVNVSTIEIKNAKQEDLSPELIAALKQACYTLKIGGSIVR